MRELANAVAKFFEDSDVVLLGAPLSASLVLSPTTVSSVHLTRNAHVA